MTDPNPYEEIDRLKRRLAAIEKAAGINPEPPTFTTKQIEDRYFYTAHRAEIMLAAREGRIIEPPEPEPVEPVEYPDSGDPRLTQVGPGVFVSRPKER
jgi:hypothetical protein